MLRDAGEGHIRRCSRFVLKAQEGAIGAALSGVVGAIFQDRVFAGGVTGVTPNVKSKW